MNKLESISYRWNDHNINEKIDSIILGSESISMNEFENMTDLSYLLDEDESLSDYISQDPGAAFFKAEVDNIQLSGFKSSGHIELFSPDGEMPDLSSHEINMEIRELNMDSLAWVLSPMNSPNSIINTKSESLRYSTSKVNCFDSDNSSRYQLMSKGKPIAAIFIKDNVIDTIYTSFEYRGKGLGRKLAEIAKKDLPDLAHSDSSTELGKKFINAVDLDRNTDSSMDY